MGLLILGVIHYYRVSASFGCFFMGYKELTLIGWIEISQREEVLT